MFWPMLAVAVGFVSVAVIGVLAVRVFVEAQRLGREVTEAGRRIGSAADDLERAASAAARTGGDVMGTANTRGAGRGADPGPGAARA